MLFGEKKLQFGQSLLLFVLLCPEPAEGIFSPCRSLCQYWQERPSQEKPQVPSNISNQVLQVITQVLHRLLIGRGVWPEVKWGDPLPLPVNSLCTLLCKCELKNFTFWIQPLSDDTVFQGDFLAQIRSVKYSMRLLFVHWVSTVLFENQAIWQLDFFSKL